MAFRKNWQLSIGLGNSVFLGLVGEAKKQSCRWLERAVAILGIRPRKSRVAWCICGALRGVWWRRCWDRPWRGGLRLHCRFGSDAFEGFGVSACRLRAGNCSLLRESKKAKKSARIG